MREGEDVVEERRGQRRGVESRAGRDGGGQPLLAVLVAIRRQRLSDPIGVEDETIAWSDVHVMLLVGEIGKHAEHGTAGRQADDLARGSDEERRVSRALCDIATIGLMQERAIRRAEELTEQLQFALNSRVVIEQAKGVVARTLDIGVDEAFEMLRRFARSRRQRLTDVAREIVENRSSVNDLVKPNRP